MITLSIFPTYSTRSRYRGVWRETVSAGDISERNTIWFEGSKIRCYDQKQHKNWGTVLFRNVRIYKLLLTANCEVFALDKSVVETNVDGCVFSFRCWCWFPVVPLYTTRPVIQIQKSENFRLFFGVDNSHSSALLLAHPASFGPIFGNFVGEPWTWKDTQL